LPVGDRDAHCLFGDIADGEESGRPGAVVGVNFEERDQEAGSGAIGFGLLAKRMAGELVGASETLARIPRDGWRLALNIEIGAETIGQVKR
jgi:hypothetical protein